LRSFTEAPPEVIERYEEMMKGEREREQQVLEEKKRVTEIAKSFVKELQEEGYSVRKAIAVIEQAKEILMGCKFNLSPVSLSDE